MIKAVVFDMGGVILDLDMERCKSTFRDRAGFVTIDEYIDTYHQRGFWGELEEGKITREEFLKKCMENSRPGTSNEVLLECFHAFIHGIPQEKVDYINALAERYPLYLLSNTNPVAMEVSRGKFKEVGLDLNKVFKKLFLSYEMKMLKPSREIYLKTIEEIGLKPEEILFVDDSERNCEVAESVGIKTLRYEPFTDLEEAVETRLKELNEKFVILAAEEVEYKKCLEYLSEFECIHMGVGAGNVIKTCHRLPEGTRVLNVGYAGSNVLEIGSVCKVKESWREMLGEYFFIDHANPKQITPDGYSCYTSNSFVTSTEIIDPVLFDMELNYIAAFTHLNLIGAVKIVSDNLSLEAFRSNALRESGILTSDDVWKEVQKLVRSFE